MMLTEITEVILSFISFQKLTHSQHTQEAWVTQSHTF